MKRRSRSFHCPIYSSHPLFSGDQSKYWGIDGGNAASPDGQTGRAQKLYLTGKSNSLNIGNKHCNQWVAKAILFENMRHEGFKFHHVWTTGEVWCAEDHPLQWFPHRSLRVSHVFRWRHAAFARRHQMMILIGRTFLGVETLRFTVCNSESRGDKYANIGDKIDETVTYAVSTGKTMMKKLTDMFGNISFLGCSFFHIYSGGKVRFGRWLCCFSPISREKRWVCSNQGTRCPEFDGCSRLLVTSWSSSSKQASLI